MVRWETNWGSRDKEAPERERTARRRNQLAHMVRKEMRKSQVERRVSCSPAARGQTKEGGKDEGIDGKLTHREKREWGPNLLHSRFWMGWAPAVAAALRLAQLAQSCGLKCFMCWGVWRCAAVCACCQNVRFQDLGQMHKRSSLFLVSREL